jgi:hypothetical protein
MSIPERFKLIFYVLPSNLDACKSAIFAAGAGKYPGPGGYTECAFVSKGTGQFRPGKSANPHVCVFQSSLFIWRIYGIGLERANKGIGWQGWRAGVCRRSKGRDNLRWEGCDYEGCCSVEEVGHFQ